MLSGETKNWLSFVAVKLKVQPKRHLFIHIPKNAGTAIKGAPQLRGRIITPIERRLVDRAYVESFKRSRETYGGHPNFEHARLIDVNKYVRLGNTAFAVVRNPWSRVVSRYLFAIQTRGLTVDDARKFENFEKFLDERFVWVDKPFFWHRAVRGWHPQVDYLVDENRRIAVDVLRQEYLGEEVNAYFGLSEALAPRNVTKGPKFEYSEVYSPKTIQIVADWYADDIDTFGFDFDTGATRNTVYSQHAA